jgi:hypothetical protein
MPSASGPVRSDATSARSAGVESACSAFKGIFRRYLELGCVRLLKNELDRRGIVSKVRIAKSGTRSGGKPFSRGALYALLANPLYIGEIRRRAPPHYAHRLRTHSAGTSSCPLERAGGGARPRLASPLRGQLNAGVGRLCVLTSRRQAAIHWLPGGSHLPATCSGSMANIIWRTSYGSTPTPNGGTVNRITAGPDGNLWFTEQDGTGLSRSPATAASDGRARGYVAWRSGGAALASA